MAQKMIKKVIALTGKDVYDVARTIFNDWPNIEICITRRGEVESVYGGYRLEFGIRGDDEKAFDTRDDMLDLILNGCVEKLNKDGFARCSPQVNPFSADLLQHLSESKSFVVPDDDSVMVFEFPYSGATTIAVETCVLYKDGTWLDFRSYVPADTPPEQVAEEAKAELLAHSMASAHGEIEKVLIDRVFSEEESILLEW